MKLLRESSVVLKRRLPQRWVNELIDAVRHAAQGKRYIDRRLASEMVLNPVEGDPLNSLTNRETEILRLMAGGFSNKEIANALDVSVQTVKWHLKNLFVKLNAGSRKHLVDRARILGIILD